MALSDTGTAIGSVSRLMKDALTNALAGGSPSPTVSVSRPEPGSSGAPPAGARINLFLYEVQLDSSLRNVALSPGRQTPLWLVLRYLLTAFDESGDSDTAGAHDLIGRAMQVLLSINQGGALQLVGTDKALLDSPEPLKVSFDDGTPDLLSRLMQGPDDRFRMSIPFQIRPVLVAAPDRPASMQLVGINYVTDTPIGLAGVHNLLLPSLGPFITSATPAQVQPGDTLSISGTGLGSDQLAVQFGAVTLPVTMQRAGTLECVVGGAALDPTRISAGTQAVAVAQTLAGKTFLSNAVSTSLVPVVAGVTASGVAAVGGGNPNVFGTIHLTGQFLGRANDYIEFGLLNDSGVAALIDRRDPAFMAPPDQTAQQLKMAPEEAVPPGMYTAVYRVNGSQSRQAFLLNLV